MKYAVVYSSQTGNTELLAEAAREAAGSENCIYFGKPCEAALQAPVIFAGFWTDKGSCDATIKSFLQKLSSQKLVLFGTAGFGGSEAYFQAIMERAAAFVPADVGLLGTYMCQGKMPEAVKKRYEKLLEADPDNAKSRQFLQNFESALTHPDAEDIKAFKAFIQSLAL